MVYDTKNRTAKRKVEKSLEEKSKKSTRLENPQEQLVLEHRTLKDKYEKLLVQNKSNLEKIAGLNKKVLHYETEAKNKHETVSTESQTTMECEDCGYPSDDLVDFGEHQYQCHGPEIENMQESVVCYLCGWKLKSKRDLMVHRKEKHGENVRMCLYYAKGNCEFSDEDCWYQHKLLESPLFPLKEFKCSLCGETFKFKHDFMNHRKSQHPENISICTKNDNGSCNFGNQKCWYKHVEKQNENEEIIENNPEIITRIFNMMETFAERFELIENQL